MEYYNEDENRENFTKGEMKTALGKPTLSQYLLGLIFFILFLIVIVWILQVSWNASMPHAFGGAKEISFTAALGLLIVAMILLKR